MTLVNNDHLSLEEIREIVRKIKFKNRELTVEQYPNSNIYLELSYSEYDSENDWDSLPPYVPENTIEDEEYGYTWIRLWWERPISAFTDSQKHWR